jgi:uncharacterized protein (DUF2147 family)
MLKITHSLALIAFTLATGAPAQTAPSLLGKWAAKDGTSSIVIAPCTGSADLCATVVAEKLAANEPSRLGKVAVRDIRFDKRKGWRGRFIDGGADYAASAKMASNDAFAFKVCVFAFVCDTQPFVRVR